MKTLLLFNSMLTHLSACLQLSKDNDLTPGETFDSARAVNSYNIQVTEKVMQRSAEALSRTGIPQRLDTQETVRKMAAMKTELVNPVLCRLFSSCTACLC